MQSTFGIDWSLSVSFTDLCTYEFDSIWPSLSRDHSLYRHDVFVFVCVMYLDMWIVCLPVSLFLCVCASFFLSKQWKTVSILYVVTVVKISHWALSQSVVLSLSVHFVPFACVTFSDTHSDFNIRIYTQFTFWLVCLSILFFLLSYKRTRRRKKNKKKLFSLLVLWGASARVM